MATKKFKVQYTFAWANVYIDWATFDTAIQAWEEMVAIRYILQHDGIKVRVLPTHE